MTQVSTDLLQIRHRNGGRDLYQICANSVATGGDKQVYLAERKVVATPSWHILVLCEVR